VSTAKSLKIRVNHDSAVVLHVQIAAQFEALIRSGLLTPGDRIPTVRRISEECGVSVVTAMRALQELARKGLVRSKTGAGTLVAEPRPATTEILVCYGVPRSKTTSFHFFREINEGLNSGYADPERRYVTTFTDGHDYTAGEIVAAARARSSDGLVAYARASPVPDALAEVSHELPCVALLPRLRLPHCDAVTTEIARPLTLMLRQRHRRGQRLFAYLGYEFISRAAADPSPYAQLPIAFDAATKGMGIVPLINRTPGDVTRRHSPLRQQADEQRQACLRLPPGCTLVAETASIADRALEASPALDIITYTESRRTAERLRGVVSLLYVGLSVAARASVSLLRSRRSGSAPPRIVSVSPDVMERDTATIA
jgi:DNA-binding transcriptional regulator YhcF (GntR family)